MRNQTQILMKGGIYGAAGARPGGDKAGGLNNGSVSLRNDSGRGPQPASGVSLVLVAKALKGRQGRRGMPEHLVRQMYADYLELKSLRLVGRKYGRTRQSMFSLFTDHGLKLNGRNMHPRIEYGGRVYTTRKSGYYHATTEPRTALHHQIWLDAGRTIPAGYQVSFKDGDKTNFDLANLFCDALINVTLFHQRRLGTKKFHTAEELRRNKAKIARDCYARRKVKFLAAGLTTTGKPRQRKPNFINAAEPPSVQVFQRDQQRQNIREISLGSYQRRAARFAEAGLTSRGTVPKRAKKFFRRTELDRQWEGFRAGIAVPTQTFCDAYMTTTEKAYK